LAGYTNFFLRWPIGISRFYLLQQLAAAAVSLARNFRSHRWPEVVDVVPLAVELVRDVTNFFDD
jgi:hypothetical protein